MTEEEFEALTDKMLDVIEPVLLCSLLLLFASKALSF